MNLLGAKPLGTIGSEASLFQSLSKYRSSFVSVIEGSFSVRKRRMSLGRSEIRSPTHGQMQCTKFLNVVPPNKAPLSLGVRQHAE